MKDCKTVLALVLTLGLVAVGNVIAQDDAGLIVYRDSNGHLTPASRESASQMTQIAAHNGEIVLWLTLNYAIDLYLDEQTDQEAIAAQDAAIHAGFAEILDPLITSGAVWYTLSGPFIRGPGCAVRANVSGLRRLIADDRILQIVAVE